MAVQIVNKNLRDERAWGGGNFPDEDVLCTFTVSTRHHVGKVSKQPSLMLTLAIASYVDRSRVRSPATPSRRTTTSRRVPTTNRPASGRVCSSTAPSCARRSSMPRVAVQLAWSRPETCEVATSSSTPTVRRGATTCSSGQGVRLPLLVRSGPADPVPDKVLPDGTVQPAGVIRQFGDMMMLTDEQAETSGPAPSSPRLAGRRPRRPVMRCRAGSMRSGSLAPAQPARIEAGRSASGSGESVLLRRRELRLPLPLLRSLLRARPVGSPPRRLPGGSALGPQGVSRRSRQASPTRPGRHG